MTASLRNQFIIAVTGAVFFLPFLGGVHLFEWDEINFAEIAREMFVSGDYLRPQIGFQSFTEKPPLFFWLQAFSMSIFGVGEYAARFPNAIAGIVVLVLLYRFGEKEKDALFGWLWAGAYFGAVLPHLYFKSGIIDPWFNLFIFLGIYGLYKHSTLSSQLFSKQLLWAGVFTGLAILTKGPAALVITGLMLVVLFIKAKFYWFLKPLSLLIYGLIALVTFMLWLGFETALHGTDFIIEFTIRQWELLMKEDAGHGGFLGYHFVVLLIGCFPISIFVIRSFFKFKNDSRLFLLTTWMKVLFWVVLILFSLVNTKIVHYSSMAYYPMSFLTALIAYQLIKGEITFRRPFKIGLGILGGLSILIAGIVPWLGKNITVLEPLVQKDAFAAANIQANVDWLGWESLVVLFLATGLFGFFRFSKINDFKKAFGFLFIGTALFVQFTLIFYIGNIEGYSQNALIEFYESKKGCNCYVQSERFKSYGMHFYTESEENQYPEIRSKKWLQTGEIDKDVFFVAKINRISELQKNPEIKHLYDKNGYSFWVRKATNNID